MKIKRRRVMLETGPGRTQQQFRDECDINVILKKYENRGVVAQRTDGRYGDFSEIPDYQTSFNAVREADKIFSEQPSRIREKFNNNPAAFLKFVQDPKNLDEMITLGLAKKPDKGEPRAPEPPSKKPSKKDSATVPVDE